MPRDGFELLNNKIYDSLISKLVDRLGMEATAEIWLNAEAWLDLLMASAPDMLESERDLVEERVLPTCAIYHAISAALGKEEAIELLRWFVRENIQHWMWRYDALFAIPGGRRIGMLLLKRDLQRDYAQDKGFDMSITESSSTRLRMEVHACPYLRWCEICGTAEVAPLFCQSDDYASAAVKGVEFTRKSTLAQGNEICDFSFKLQ